MNYFCIKLHRRCWGSEVLKIYLLFQGSKEKHKKTIYITIPFCQSNEHYPLRFIKKLEGFTKENLLFVLI